jgi:hypothetical protein
VKSIGEMFFEAVIIAIAVRVADKTLRPYEAKIA